MVASAAQTIDALLAKRVAGVAAFRATVTAVDGALVQIQRVGEDTAGTEAYATVSRFALQVGDVVLCIPLGSRPMVIDVIRYATAAASTPTFTALANAGSTATTTNSAGNDRDGVIQVNSAGTGQAAGNFIDVTFAVAKASTNYRVLLTPASSAARSLTVIPGRNAKSTTKVTLSIATALVAGSAYVWDYNFEMYG